MNSSSSTPSKALGRPPINPISHEMTLGLRLTEARREITYWKRQRELRPMPSAKAEAGARVLVWESTAAAIEAEIDLLNLAPSI